MKKRKLFIFVLICIIVFSFFYYIFYFLGNNNNINQDEIVDNILNKLKNYEANITVHVVSNKNENYYKMFQCVNNEKSKIVIKEPENIQGMTIEKNSDCLKIVNVKLNMEKVYEQYNIALNNSLFLTTFLEEYKNNDSKNYEKDDEIIFEIRLKNNLNTYSNYKELHVSKLTGIPKELIVKDNTQKTRVSIIYNDIEIK